MFNFKRSLECLILILPFLSGHYQVEKKEDDYKELKKQGYNSWHIRGCGPKALSTLLEKFEIKKEEKEISKEILKSSTTGNIIRNILSNLDDTAMAITWPWEMENSLKNYFPSDKYEIIKKTGTSGELSYILKEINKKQEKAMVLIKNEENSKAYHWINSFQNPEGVYKDKTSIQLIYIIEEKPSNNP